MKRRRVEAEFVGEDAQTYDEYARKRARIYGVYSKGTCLVPDLGVLAGTVYKEKTLKSPLSKRILAPFKTAEAMVNYLSTDEAKLRIKYAELTYCPPVDDGDPGGDDFYFPMLLHQYEPETRRISIGSHYYSGSKNKFRSDGKQTMTFTLDQLEEWISMTMAFHVEKKKSK